jgi:hypothetical protein
MNLVQYYEKFGLEGERKLAAKALMNPRYIYQVRTGRRNPSVTACKRLIEASGFKLTMRSLLANELNVSNPDRYWSGKRAA